jgi:hypothetical protein
MKSSMTVKEKGDLLIQVFIFFHNLTLGYMTKTLNHIIFFSSTKIRIYFFSNIGNQNIFYYMCIIFIDTVKPVLRGHLWDKEKLAL